jgi:quinol monooxygenase YgiN
MIFIVVKFTVRPEFAEAWLPAVEPFTTATRQEPGNLWFDWSHSVDDPNQFVLLEAFEEGSAGSDHVHSEHFQAAMQLMPTMLAKTPEIVNVRVPGDEWAEMGELTVTPAEVADVRPPAARWATAVLDVAPGEASVSAGFWCAVTGSSLSSGRGVRNELTTLLPPDGDAYLGMQELAVGPAASHLDLHVEDVAAAAEHAKAVGSDARSEPGASPVVLASPGGYVFCLVPYHGEVTRPAPVRSPGGHRSLVDQVCIDVPPSMFEAEVAFWAAITGWEPAPASRPTFRVLWRPDGQPVRLLFQRLEEVEPGQRVTAHLDLSCDDAEAEADRHVALGARIVRRMPYWVTLDDPTGRRYCVTRRDPDTGMLAH